MEITYKSMLYNVVGMYDHFKRLKRLLERPRQPGVFWPSEASADIFIDRIYKTIGKCSRANYYDICGVPPKAFGYTTIMKFRLGDLVEHNEINASRLISPKIYAGVPLSFKIPGTELEIHGKIDHIIQDRASNKYVIIEHKSSYGYQMETEIIKKNKYKEPNAMQLGLYMYAIRILDLLLESEYKIGSTDVQEGVLLYTDRGSCDNADDIVIDIDNSADGKKYILVTTKSMQTHRLVSVDAMFNKWQTLHQYVVERKLPPQDFVPSCDENTIREALNRVRITREQGFEMMKKNKVGYPCSWCDYRPMCINNENVKSADEYKNEIQIMYTEVIRRFKEIYNLDIEEYYSKDEPR